MISDPRHKYIVHNRLFVTVHNSLSKLIGVSSVRELPSFISSLIIDIVASLLHGQLTKRNPNRFQVQIFIWVISYHTCDCYGWMICRSIWLEWNLLGIFVYSIPPPFHTLTHTHTHTRHTHTHKPPTPKSMHGNYMNCFSIVITCTWFLSFSDIMALTYEN